MVAILFMLWIFHRACGSVTCACLTHDIAEFPNHAELLHSTLFEDRQLKAWHNYCCENLGVLFMYLTTQKYTGKEEPIQVIIIAEIQ